MNKEDRQTIDLLDSINTLFTQLKGREFDHPEIHEAVKDLCDNKQIHNVLLKNGEIRLKEFKDSI